MEMTVRPLTRGDEAQWRRLWRAYLDFYDTSLPDAQYVDTFERLLGDDPWQPSGLIAEADGRAVGLTHYLFHSHCWRPERSLYLQDLYADETVRGRGIGRRLIEAIYAVADREGTPVYWMTQANNANARLLYDRIGRSSGFVQYVGPA